MCRGVEESELSTRRLVEEAVRALFGESGASAAQVDVLRVSGRRALLRVAARELVRVRAALALNPRQLRVRQAPSLQALL